MHETGALSLRRPEVFEPLQTWVGGFFGIAYRVHLVAVAGFGWGVLRAGLLAPWVGWQRSAGVFFGSLAP